MWCLWFIFLWGVLGDKLDKHSSGGIRTNFLGFLFCVSCRVFDVLILWGVFFVVLFWFWWFFSGFW